MDSDSTPRFFSPKISMSKIEKAPRPIATQRTPEQVEAKFKEAGELYEKQFLRELVKAMRSSVQESSLVPKSQAEKIYQEQLDHQMVEAWGDRGGVGLGDMITDRLIQQYGQQAGLKKYQR